MQIIQLIQLVHEFKMFLVSLFGVEFEAMPPKQVTMHCNAHEAKQIIRT